MKSVSRPESHADLLLAQAVDTLVDTYLQTKTFHESGVGGIDRAKACKIIAARAVKLASRGWPWKYLKVTDATVPQM
jgi:hypothetical protein